MSKIVVKRLCLVACFIVSGTAIASGGGTLPWETPLQTIANSLTGPVAFSLGLIGMFVAGGMLLFGGELSDWARRVVIMVLAVALVVNAANLYTTLFGATASMAVDYTEQISP